MFLHSCLSCIFNAITIISFDLFCPSSKQSVVAMETNKRGIANRQSGQVCWLFLNSSYRLIIYNQFVKPVIVKRESLRMHAVSWTSVVFRIVHHILSHILIFPRVMSWLIS